MSGQHDPATASTGRISNNTSDNKDMSSYASQDAAMGRPAQQTATRTPSRWNPHSCPPQRRRPSRAAASMRVVASTPPPGPGRRHPVPPRDPRRRARGRRRSAPEGRSNASVP